MDDRLVQFVAGLRAAGVRVSLAESQDAFLATQSVGVMDRATFRMALKTTLVKERADGPTFDRLFALYFGVGAPPLLPASEALSPEAMERLRQALSELAGELQDLLRRLLEGQDLGQADLERAARAAGLAPGRSRGDPRRLTPRLLEGLGLAHAMEQIAALLQRLTELGLDPESLARLQALLQGNLEAIARQAEQFLGAGLARRLAETRPQPEPGEALLQRPFRDLSADEAHALRQQVTRLAAQLRTRAALRMRRGKGRTLDVKATLRANVRYAGVPFNLVHKQRRRKARFTVICDVSTSMRPAVDFLLLLVYQLQDQVSRTRSFAFIDHLEEISLELASARPEAAVPEVFRRLPPGHYNTDLGRSLEQMEHEFPDAVDRRTTLIVCGDGRNNYNDPRADLLQRLARRARRSVWFNPEPAELWELGDSDMAEYSPLVDAVYQVSNLEQLARAVDRLFV